MGQDFLRGHMQGRLKPVLTRPWSLSTGVMEGGGGGGGHAEKTEACANRTLAIVHWCYGGGGGGGSEASANQTLVIVNWCYGRGGGEGKSEASANQTLVIVGGEEGDPVSHVRKAASSSLHPTCLSNRQCVWDAYIPCLDCVVWGKWFVCLSVCFVCGGGGECFVD